MEVWGKPKGNAFVPLPNGKKKNSCGNEVRQHPLPVTSVWAMIFVSLKTKEDICDSEERIHHFTQQNTRTRNSAAAKTKTTQISRCSWWSRHTSALIRKGKKKKKLQLRKVIFHRLTQMFCPCKQPINKVYFLRCLIIQLQMCVLLHSPTAAWTHEPLWQHNSQETTAVVLL